MEWSFHRERAGIGNVCVKPTVHHHDSTKTAMVANDEKQCWDPYETSQRREFIYRPNPATEALWSPTKSSKLFRDSYSLSAPMGSTLYNDGFCWKPAPKRECIRTGTASGQRRNNPHPNQYFMTWRLPKDTTQSSADVRFLWKCPPCEEDICKAMTAQYRTTYRTDFTGIPQVVRQDVTTLMMQKCDLHLSELQGNQFHDGCNARHNDACEHIPVVFPSHICKQQKESDLTTYDRFFGKRTTNVTSALKSLQHWELQQLLKIVPEKEKEVVETFFSSRAHPNHGEKVKQLLAVTPEWISSWLGPH